MKNYSLKLISAAAVACALGATVVFAQSDPNSIFDYTTQNSNNAYSQGSYDAGTVYNGTDTQNNNAYSQGYYDAQNANYFGHAVNSSLPNPSAFNAWITGQSQNANTNALFNGSKVNDAISNDLYDPNTPLTDVNSGIYNAGSSANQSITTSNACSADIEKFADIFVFGTCLINRFLLSIALSIGTLYFVWGVVQYVLSAGSAEERKKSKQVMLWGVFSLFVIVSMWGIVAALRTLFGF
jgi:hypothetical protein